MSKVQRHYRNGFNQKSVEYEDDEYDDYEEDGIEDEADDQEEKVEELKPNKEELEYLKLREKLKEKFRQKLKMQSDHTIGHSCQVLDRKKASTNDNFGSFFGPSRPAIASRVLDESRSIRETQHITYKVPSSSFGHGGVSTFSSSDRKLHERQQIPRVNEVKVKAQTLKDMRDYSFLFSDDVDLPDKEQPSTSRHEATPKPVARSAQTPLKSKVIASRPLKSVQNGHELKNAIQASRHVQTTMPIKVAQVTRRAPSAEPKKISGSFAGGIGPGRPVELKPLPKLAQSKVPPQSKVDGQVMVTKKPIAKGMNGLSSQKNLPTLKPYNSTQNHYVEQKRASQVEKATVRAEPKLGLKKASPSKYQLNPPKSIPSGDIRKKRPIKRPVEIKLDEDDDADAIQMIRNMFRYNPSKYTGMDDDDSDMEAGFNQILQEERRSAQIARKEDEEQLLLIEEEERRERMRKKQKLNRR